MAGSDQTKKPFRLRSQRWFDDPEDPGMLDIVGFDAAIRVKSRKPPAEYLMTSLSVTRSRSEAVPTIV